MKFYRLLVALVVLCVGLIFSVQITSAEVTKSELQSLARALPKSITVRVLGLASGTSEWTFLTKPFWEKVVPELSGGKIKVNLKSITELGVSGDQMVRLVKTGIVDIADPVANYAAKDIKELDALDLSGVATTWDQINKACAAYIPIVNKILEERMGVSILAYWPATGQVLWCHAKVEKLADLKGKKVRVWSATMADFMAGLGAIPVNMSFAEMTPALQRGVIDCGITGTASGNTSKLFEVADYLYELNVGWAPQIRIVNKKWFAAQNPKVQEWLKKASLYFQESMALPVQKRNNDMGVWCSCGDARCDTKIKGFTKASMKLNRPTSEQEKAKIKQAVEKNVLSAFAKSANRKCVEDWNNSIGKALDLKMSAK